MPDYNSQTTNLTDNMDDLRDGSTGRGTESTHGTCTTVSNLDGIHSYKSLGTIESEGSPIVHSEIVFEEVEPTHSGHNLMHRMRDVTDDLSHRAHDLRDRMSSRLHDLTDTLGQSTSAAKDFLTTKGSDVRSQMSNVDMKKMMNQVECQVRCNPEKSLMIAAAVGLGLGLIMGKRPTSSMPTIRSREITTEDLSSQKSFFAL
jgi:ElaB/YqjD/DUF883 family membrane-anchored ribosome-binding protein